jgi:hypothetical protein
MSLRSTGLAVGLLLLAAHRTSADPIRVGLFGTLYSLTDTDRSTFADLPDDFGTHGGTISLPDSYLPPRTLQPNPDVPGEYQYGTEHVAVDQPFWVQLLFHRSGDGPGDASAGITLSGHLAGAFDGTPGFASMGGGFSGTVDHVDVRDWRPAGAGVPPGFLDDLGDPNRFHIAAQVTGGSMNIVKMQVVVDPVPVPEPTPLAVLLVGFALAALRRRRAG